jgi:plastocyanin
VLRNSFRSLLTTPSLWLAAVLMAVATGAGMLFGGAAPAVAGGGCRGVPATEADGTAVNMTDGLCFLPTVLHAKPGEAITWTNTGSAPHSIAAATLGWGNYTEVPGGSAASYTFDEPGTYPYYCFVHPGMTGAIVVGDGRGASSAVQSARAVQVNAAPPADARSDSAPATVAAPDDDNPRWLYAGMGVLGGLAAAGLGFGLLSARRSGRS